ncbi:MAG: XdhC family protein [Deltaproteobacteria bacterium]|nr:XdhC family protein [Deltaproteobacteria bacterium]
MSHVQNGDLLDAMFELKDSGVPFVTATVIGTRGSCPRKAGAKMAVAADGRTFGTVGGGSVEAKIIEKAKRLLEDPEVARFEWNLGSEDAGEMHCGGRMEFLLEPFLCGPRAFVFGGGHVGQALCRVLGLLSFHVTVVDEREGLLKADRLPNAALVHAQPATAAAQLPIGTGSFCVVVNPSHKQDLETMEVLVGRSPRYLGLMASRKKKKDIFKALAEQGAAAEALEHVHCPVGLEIGSETPEEIALSIAAEMVRELRKPEGVR